MGMLWDLTRGGVAGAAGTWMMDLVTTTLLQQQRSDVTQREEQARPGGASSLENLLALIERRTGIQVPPERRDLVLQALHYGLGVAPGAVYGLLKRRAPLIAVGGGLAYGALLWALNDEWLNTALGLAGPPDAYPPETHFRGFVGHAVLGATTDTLLEVIPG